MLTTFNIKDLYLLNHQKTQSDAIDSHNLSLIVAKLLNKCEINQQKVSLQKPFFLKSHLALAKPLLGQCWVTAQCPLTTHAAAWRF